MTTDNYTAETALRAYFTSSSSRSIGRHWAKDGFLHDAAAVGFVSFFEGGGADPTVLDGYDQDKIWLRQNSGVTSSSGEVRSWNGSSPASNLSNWPEMTEAAFAARFLALGAVTSVNTRTGNVTLDKTDVGLSNVDNTADAAKPVSTPQATELALKADLASPALTGTPTSPTPATVDSSTKIATTEYVTNKVASVSSGVTTFNGRSGAVTSTSGDYSAGQITGLAASATTDTTNASNISSGTLAETRGGAGAVNGLMKANGSGVVSAAAAGTDYVVPGGALGTPSSGTLTNATGLPIGSGVSGLAAGVATFLTTPSSSNLKAAVTDETGSGALVFATSPTLVTPALGTPASGVLTNCTGLPMATGVTGILPNANGGTGSATDALSGFKNRLINGCMRINQRSATSQTDDSYGYDRWNVLTQTGAIGISAANAIANGWPYAMRLTQSQASAQRFGVNQIIEQANCLDLRGGTVTASARVQCSTATNIRIWILEWTGSSDAVTSDSVNDWTSATFTAGNFFISTTTTVVGTATTALSANTPTTISVSGTVSSSMTNLIVGITTDSTQAQNVTLDIGKASLIPGATVLDFEVRPIAVEMAMCQRYYERMYAQILGYGAAASNGGIHLDFIPKRSTPTFSNISNNAAFTESNCGTTVSTQTGVSTSGALFYRPVTATGAFQFSEIWAVSAEL